MGWGREWIPRLTTPIVADMARSDTLEYLAFRGGLGLLRTMPGGLGGRALGGAARALGRWRGVRRDLVRNQLAAVYPDLGTVACDRLADAVFDHLVRTATEVFLTDPASLLAGCRVEPGWAPIDRALAAGRGAIVATGHVGNFELGGRLLASRYDLLDVVKPQRNPRFEGYLRRLRNRHGIATVTMDRAARVVLAHLAAGGLVSLLVDQDAGAAGLPLDFLGRPASTWPGAARFALHTGCPVIPMAIHREADGHVLEVGEVIDVEQAAADPDRVRGLMERISREVEVFIHQHPEQWFWVHRRWKGAASAGKAVPLQEKP